MKLIVCIDDNGGVAFNHRRQSRDRFLIDDIIEGLRGEKIFIEEYSLPLREAFYPEQRGESSVVLECRLKESKKWFIITFIGVSIGMFAETARAILDVYRISPVLYRIITLIEFSITPLFPIPLSLACGIKKPAKYAGVVLLIHAFIELVLSFTGLIFSVDSNGVYSRGDLYFIYIISYVISLLYLIFLSLHYLTLHYY